MQEQLDKLFDAIKADYANFMKGDGEVQQNMREKFNESLSCKVGNKYIKIMTGDSVWGFIVNTASDKKFRNGDILKAAGWSTPTRNKARGNIFEDYKVNWTGPRYLK